MAPSAAALAAVPDGLRGLVVGGERDDDIFSATIQPEYTLLKIRRFVQSPGLARPCVFYEPDFLPPARAAALYTELQASPGRHRHSTLPLAGIGCHCLGVYTVISRSLLSISVEMTVPPGVAAGHAGLGALLGHQPLHGAARRASG